MVDVPIVADAKKAVCTLLEKRSRFLFLNGQMRLTAGKENILLHVLRTGENPV